MENWRGFLLEDALQQELSLLVEGELNENALQKAINSFKSFFQKGGTEESAKKQVNQIEDPERRKFLRGALATAVLSAAGSSSSALAHGGDSGGGKIQKVPNNVLNIFDDLISEIIDTYKPDGVAGKRIIQQLPVLYEYPIDEKTLKQSKEIYIATIYPQLGDFVYDLDFVGLANGTLNKNALAIFMPDKNRIGINMDYPYDKPEDFKNKTGSTIKKTIQHELEHFIDFSIGAILKQNKYILSTLAIPHLSKIFDLTDFGIKQYDTVGVDEVDVNAWGQSVEELYADFKALRSRLPQNKITREDLDVMCMLQKDARDGLSIPEKYTMNALFYRLLKCKSNQFAGDVDDAVDAANTFAANKKIDRLMTSPSQRKTAIAEKQSKK